MPIKIPNNLPATETLRNENIFVMTETRALTQDIRPLEILVLNILILLKILKILGLSGLACYVLWEITNRGVLLGRRRRVLDARKILARLRIVLV